jgi:hypothetical protein
VTRLLEEHVARRADNSRQLWGLMCFSLWVEHVDQSPAVDRQTASARGVSG